MKIIDAINQIDKLKPNSYDTEEKVSWLFELDHIICANIINAHADVKTDFSGYDGETDMETELLVPAPYDEIYTYWLGSKIDYWNQDTEQYNNSMTMYNNAYEEYARFFRRENKPHLTSFTFY